MVSTTHVYIFAELDGEQQIMVVVVRANADLGPVVEAVRRLRQAPAV